MPLALLPNPHTLVEYGAVLVGVGSILSVIGVVRDKDKERIIPWAIVLIAFGGVLALAPIYAVSGGSPLVRVIAGIAAVALVFAALRPLRWLIRLVKKRIAQGEDYEEQQEQAPRPIGNDVRDEQHPATIGVSTLTASEKSLANGSILIAVGLTLLMKGLYALRAAVSRN
jgi:uncharacterized membrane protein